MQVAVVSLFLLFDAQKMGFWARFQSHHGRLRRLPKLSSVRPQSLEWVHWEASLRPQPSTCWVGSEVIHFNAIYYEPKKLGVLGVGPWTRSNNMSPCYLSWMPPCQVFMKLGPYQHPQAQAKAGWWSSGSTLACTPNGCTTTGPRSPITIAYSNTF